MKIWPPPVDLIKDELGDIPKEQLELLSNNSEELK